jgi:FdhE protein
MQRILDPAQIEAFAQRSIPRVNLADPATVFRKRAERLHELSKDHAIGEYLSLMAALCEVQHRVLARGTADSDFEMPADLERRIERARQHDLPLLQAQSWPRHASWRAQLKELCTEVAPLAPAPVRAICLELAGADAARLEAQADCALDDSGDGLELQAAPFVMAGLQVYWALLVKRLGEGLAQDLESTHDRRANSATAGVCPVCGSLPLASIVRTDGARQGYRYLHCGLCATEWHLVRIKCSHCLSTEGIRYHYVHGGSEAIRAESCESCLNYRKILYREKDPAVEPVADDLASLALDLLMGSDKYHRASGNPLLWQPLAP